MIKRYTIHNRITEICELLFVNRLYSLTGVLQEWYRASHLIKEVYVYYLDASLKRPVGTFVLLKEIFQDEGYNCATWVDSEHRRKGIGKELIEVAKKYNDAETIRPWTDEDPAYTFYQNTLFK